MFDEGDLPLRTGRTIITPGEDLSEFSVEGLKERVELLNSEIARAEAMIQSKTAGRAAAESVFRKS
ncbi:DUF1192 domain-containing protein [Hyphobacterium sp. SN044]|uniref:DUF1192 domain-containing protein n=1 Tax=Hyphobacterium sp. SN044 TaxID=2912575 RepID=UPI001F1A5153|nr:DUF1192 domain-containing protein [Hyphobacterium sp. SN044]MCF8879982.1 DUF1192 domain-containing protein [Hyphobacterium sp. SN044]